MKRRLRGRCYYCGDPSVDEWFCAAHTWASPPAKVRTATEKAIDKLSRDHAYWIERFTPEQIVELAEALS